MRERISEHDQNAIGVERLFKYLVCARLRRFDGGADGSVSADHHHGGGGIELANLFQRFHAVHPGHLYVEKDEMRPPLLIFRYSVSRVRESVDLVALVLEQL